MKKEVKVSAKTVDEALDLAAEQLGVSVAEIEYTVTAEGKKGFLGIGATDAEIIASYTPSGEVNAVNFIKTIVDDMGIEAEITTSYGENGALIIDIKGKDVGKLIGHRGDTLDALQYLTGLAANRREIGEDGEKAERGEYIKVALNIDGYREKREGTLRELARKQAARVLKHKRSVVLDPMNPYERRIIHSEVQGIEGVSTYSIGSENNRRVVIFFEDKKAKTAADEEEN